jgi:hexosaminidase
MPSFDEKAAGLCPPPRSVAPLATPFVLPRRLAYALPQEGRQGPLGTALARLAATLRAWDVELVHDPSAPAGLRLFEDPGFPPEAYKLDVDATGIGVAAAGSAGFFYAIATLRQWLGLHAPGGHGSASRTIAGLRVDDAPSFRHRGLLLDVSRNRVPRMDALLATVDLLADLKINQLQLYFEHAFAYVGHSDVWRDASPFTAAEIRELDAYCAARAIELVPNQNSFGHFHRWLVHDAYRPLAENPEGIEHPFSLRREPFSLCPLDPGSLGLLRDLYGQLLPHFSSRTLNTGLDETFDLGRGRSAEECARRGKSAVYLDFLARVHTLCRENGRRMQFWGDVVLEHPEAIAELPEDVVALEWGYEADHPFAADAARFAASGREFYVCPGTSSWNSLTGRTTNAEANLAAAAQAGAEHGAAGYLLTDWGDHGHLQPPPISWPAYVLGAAHAWRADAKIDRERWAGWVDRHVLGKPNIGLGSLLLRLGDVYLETGATSKNGSALFFALLFAHKDAADRRGQGMTQETLEATRQELAAIGDLLGPLCRAQPDPWLETELRWVLRTSDLAARIAEGRLRQGEDLPLATLPERAAWVEELEKAAEALRPIWRARARPGGLEASIARLLALRDLA